MEVLKNFKPSHHKPVTIELEQALLLAIEKLELLEKVERAGVKKLECHKHDTFKAGQVMLSPCETCDRNDIFNEAIDLCNAHLARKLEGLEEVIRVNSEKIYDEKTGRYMDDTREIDIYWLAQTIKNYMEEGR